MKLYLVSAGENDGDELTPRGSWQIKTLARKLRDSRLEASYIYVNSHKISKETGKILSRSLNVPLISDERFSELNPRVFNGEFSEKDVENINFVNLFLNEIIESGKDSIISVADGVQRQIVSRLTGLPLSSTMSFSFYNGSISLINYEGDGATGSWRIAYLNDISHLRIP